MAQACTGMLTVEDVTVSVTVRRSGRRTLSAGWLPGAEGTDMGAVAAPGKAACIVIPGRARFTGRITEASPENCDLTLDITAPLPVPVQYTVWTWENEHGTRLVSAAIGQVPDLPEGSQTRLVTAGWRQARATVNALTAGGYEWYGWAGT